MKNKFNILRIMSHRKFMPTIQEIPSNDIIPDLQFLFNYFSLICWQALNYKLNNKNDFFFNNYRIFYFL